MRTLQASFRKIFNKFSYPIFLMYTKIVNNKNKKIASIIYKSLMLNEVTIYIYIINIIEDTRHKETRSNGAGEHLPEARPQTRKKAKPTPESPIRPISGHAGSLGSERLPGGLAARDTGGAVKREPTDRPAGRHVGGFRKIRTFNRIKHAMRIQSNTIDRL